MPLSVKEDESLNPTAIGLFGSQTEMPEASRITNLIEQSPVRHD
jgi:hypothetical protein